MNSGHAENAGGWLSTAVGFSYLIVGVTFFLMPEVMRPSNSNFGDFMASLAAYPTPFIIFYGVFGLGALSAIGVVPAVSRFFKAEANGWLVWFSNIALLGFAIQALDFFRFISYVPAEAAVFVQQEELGRFAISGDNFHLNLDPDGWFQFGATGLWILMVSIRARRNQSMPAGWSLIGFAAAISFWLILAASLFNIGLLFVIGTALGGLIMVPAWFIWLGIRMRQERKN